MSLFRQRGDARRRPGEQDNENNLKEIRVCLIVFGGSSHRVFYFYSIGGVAKKQFCSISIGLLDALTVRFVDSEKTMHARDTSKRAGSRARGEG